MTLPPTAMDRLLRITLSLGQYPILGNRIRARMRRELFERGVVDPHVFDAEVRQRAILSQKREGLYNPLVEEAAETWELRHNLIREQLTDFYFSQNLPFSLFEKIVRDVLGERGVTGEDFSLSINPELAPLDLLFDQARAIESFPAAERARLEPRLRETKVVLIRSLISDQLGYINIAKEWFTIADLEEIRRRKIGAGRIGGKAAGMLLAARILNQAGGEALRARITLPDSYFLGSDLLYTFMSMNNLVHWNDQKYKPEEQMRAEYPDIQRDFEAGEFPIDVLDKLRALLEAAGQKPLIVRSSSLLEDNFGTSFAGKYESFFCPNQGTPEENLQALTLAIARIYATILNPNALLYRRSKSLQDYDERMAVLIQTVQGERFGRYYLPTAAGVAFSRNLYRWSPQIRQDQGFVRLVWGMGTRAVDRVGNDYPCLVALSHPLLRPNSTPKLIRRYSQHYVDLIDLECNEFRTLPVHEVFTSRYPPLRYVTQLEQDGYFSSLRSSMLGGEPSHLVVTFEEFLRRTPFAETMRDMLQILEKNYNCPVDMEFTAEVVETPSPRPEICISIIQCRPQSHLRDAPQARLPVNLNPEAVVLATGFMVPQGYVPGIRKVLFVEPEGYFALPTPEARAKLGRLVGQVNARLEGVAFVCVGPGRWGTSNPDLGVTIGYADIYNSRALIELTGQGIGLAPDPSFGTHFFQDLMEAQIYPLAVYLDDPGSVFNREFFYRTPNHLAGWLPNPADAVDCLRLIDVGDFRPNHHLELVMDNDLGRAVAYLAPDLGAPPSALEPDFSNILNLGPEPEAFDHGG
ncbi:MAG TPA: PEP/pyruvate-binding domain-containing protein [Anaerolineaceae bacterium]|nr:PEP/pyruvate-binding domain-containing protein [Anaerolineaceae bacterium]